jgi:Concanavalin A-like lectin/glucanases superfamily
LAQDKRGASGLTRLPHWAWINVVLAACSPQEINVVGCALPGCDGGARTATAISPTISVTADGADGADGLIHRYSFDGTPDATVVVDSVGGANGTLVGAVFGSGAKAGSVVLAGAGSDEYVDLPNYLLEGLEDITFEAWFTWGGGNAWQRVFDFGEDDTGLDDSRAGVPRSYIFLSCNPQPRFGFKQASADYPEMMMTGAKPLPTDRASHIAVVLDSKALLASLYVDGAQVASLVLPTRQHNVSDVNNWLGRSLYRTDPNFEGSFDEFRIFARALTPEQVAKSYLAGPETLPE